MITDIETITASAAAVVVAGYDLLLGSIAAFYVFAVPYTKVEESFNIQVLQLFHKTILELFK
jgi:alpha-1,6-mannosyltransferase